MIVRDLNIISQKTGKSVGTFTGELYGDDMSTPFIVIGILPANIKTDRLLIDMMSDGKTAFCLSYNDKDE